MIIFDTLQISDHRLAQREIQMPRAVDLKHLVGFNFCRYFFSLYLCKADAKLDRRKKKYQKYQIKSNLAGHQRKK